MKWFEKVSSRVSKHRYGNDIALLIGSILFLILIALSIIIINTSGVLFWQIAAGLFLLFTLVSLFVFFGATSSGYGAGNWFLNYVMTCIPGLIMVISLALCSLLIPNTPSS